MQILAVPCLLLTISPAAVCVPAEVLACRVPETRTCSADLGPAGFQNTGAREKSDRAEQEHSGTGVWCLEYAGFPAIDKRSAHYPSALVVLGHAVCNFFRGR